MDNKEILSFSVYGQYCKRTDHKTVVNKSKNILKCKFLFKTDVWDNVEKFVLFKNKTDNYQIHLGRGCNVDCIVPWEVLKGKYFRLTVYGGDETDLVTTNEVTIPLVKSGYTTDITPTVPPSKDVFIEIFEELDTKYDDLQYEDYCIKCYSNGVLKNVIDLPFVDDARVIELVEGLMQDYINRRELMEILSGYVKDIRFEDGKLIFE